MNRVVTIYPLGRGRALPSQQPMTKNNLIDHVSEAMKGTKKDAEVAVDTLLTSIVDALAKGEKVDLRGFGSFQISGKKERQGRNPRTGETMTIAARNVAVFKPSKDLSSRVNGTAQDNAEGIAEPSEESTKVHSDKSNTQGTGSTLADNLLSLPVLQKARECQR